MDTKNTDATTDSGEGKLYDKVAKLLAKAERAGTSEEAEAFFAKAQELITRHSLDEMLLRQKVNGGTGKQEDISSEAVHVVSIYFHEDVHLWHVVAKANQCRCLTRSKGWPKEKQGVVIIGTPTDRDAVKLLMASLSLQIARATKTAPPGLVKREKYVWRRSFRQGFASEIDKRLTEARRTAAQGHTTGDLLPMLIDQDKRVEDWMRDHFNVGKTRTRSAQVDGDGVAAGRSAGRRADVGASRVSGARGELG